MIEFSNGLNKAEEEMLQIAEEECAELIQAISKIRRHGVDNHYQDGSSNRSHFEEEAGDVIACLAVLTHNGLLARGAINLIARAKLDRLKVPGNDRVHFITPEMIP